MIKNDTFTSWNKIILLFSQKNLQILSLFIVLIFYNCITI